MSKKGNKKSDLPTEDVAYLCKPLKVIIAGSRDIADQSIVAKAVKASGFSVGEVVSGTAPGVDKLGEIWAKFYNVPIKRFPADWKNIKVRGAVVKEGAYGPYNAMAGFNRNEEMAKYADACIIITNGSNGAADMMKRAEKHELLLYVWEM
jgi:hypothetical protein